METGKESQNCRCLQVLGASKTASLDLGKVPCDMLVVAHGLCVGLGWAGLTVGPAGLMWGTHTCACEGWNKSVPCSGD